MPKSLLLALTTEHYEPMSLPVIFFPMNQFSWKITHKITWRDLWEYNYRSSENHILMQYLSTEIKHLNFSWTLARATMFTNCKSCSWLWHRHLCNVHAANAFSFCELIAIKSVRTCFGEISLPMRHMWLLYIKNKHTLSIGKLSIHIHILIRL